MIVTWTVGAVSPPHRYLSSHFVETWLSAVFVIVITPNPSALMGSYEPSIAMRGSWQGTVAIRGRVG